MKLYQLYEETLAAQSEPDSKTLASVLSVIKSQYGIISMPKINLFSKVGNRKTIKYSTSLLGLPTFTKNIVLRDILNVCDLVISCIPSGIGEYDFTVFINIGLSNSKPKMIRLGKVQFNGNTFDWIPENELTPEIQPQ